MLDAKALADRLAQEFGLAIQGDLVRDKRGTILRFRPADLPKAHGFSVQVTLGWRSAEADFVPDTYAREIVHAMQEAWPSRHLVFETFARATRDAGIQLNVVIGGSSRRPPACGNLEPSTGMAICRDQIEEGTRGH